MTFPFKMSNPPVASKRKRSNKKKASPAVVVVQQQPQRARRSKRIGKTSLAGLTNKLAALVTRRNLGDDDQKISIGAAGARFADMVCDPLGQSHNGRPTMERAPDSDDYHTYLLRATGQATFAAATATSGYIHLAGHCVTGTTSDQSLQITYGADANDASATMTTVAEYFDNEYTLLGSLCSATHQARMLAAVINITPVKTDSADGHFEGLVTPKQGRYAVASYFPNAEINSGKRTGSTTYDVRTGITVRRGVDPADMAFRVCPASIYDGSSVGNKFGQMPIVRFWGLSAGLVLNISWSYILEVVPQSNCPLEVADSSFEKNWTSLCQAINRTDWASEGHSFKSFMQTVWTKLKQGATWAWDNRETLTAAGQMIAKTMA